MSKNYDMIATVDIDIATPIVDGTSFDNILIVGPMPKVTPEKEPAKVGVYASLDEVLEAGWVASGDDSDPVGVAAQVAFSQSPRPSAVYIAVQQPTEDAVAAGEMIATLNEALDKHTTAYEKVGCSVIFDKAGRKIEVVLEVPFAEADGHGLFQALAEFVEEGYTATIDGITVEHYGHFKQTEYDAKLLAMQKGDEPVVFDMHFSKEGVPEVVYKIAISYPDEEKGIYVPEEIMPANAPEKELENPVSTLERAVAVNGWYVVCPAGIDPKTYEDIAAYIEAQEKMFCYTELGFFGVGEEGENKPLVSDIYFRTMAIYGRVNAEQTEEEIPEANRYLNVAHAVKWLRYEAGSETAAFKTLAGVHPSELTTTEMKALEAGKLNYFITVGNRNITMNGMTLGGEWADIIRFRDWLKNDMQVRVVNLFVVNPKVPYTDSGIALVQNQMIASLKEGQNKGGIAEDEFDVDGKTISGFTTSVPLAATISASEKASRKLKNCKFCARLAGAIHFAELRGTFSYEL